MKRVGYLGPRGTFTEMAARVLFHEQVLEPFDTIAEGMKLTQQQRQFRCLRVQASALEVVVVLAPLAPSRWEATLWPPSGTLA